jgi:hypothetical protein
VERRVFVSSTSNRGLDERRRQVKAAIIDRIKGAGYSPQEFFESGIAGNRAWSFSNVDEVMRQCIGAVVIGFPRWQVTTENVETRLVGEYSHYEGAVAITLGLPLLLIAERNVESRGIIWTGAGRAITDLPDDADPAWASGDEFTKRFTAWTAEIGLRRDIFLGYCSKSAGTAAQIQLHLVKLGATVLNWEMDFTAGDSILRQIQDATDRCTAGIFLFSEDDPLEGTETVAAPRDNVVFEAGHFMAAKGPMRCLIVREGKAKMPADVGGSIYLSLPKGGDVSALEGRLRDFLERNL